MDALCQFWLKLAMWFWRSRKCEQFTNGETDRRTTGDQKAHLSLQLDKQSSTLCFFAFKYSRIPVKSRCMQRYITNNMYQLILQMHVLVSSLHILWHDLLFVFQLNKNSTIRLWSLYITFYFHCKCAKFSGACTQRNARSVALRSAFYMGREETFMISLQL